LQLRFWSSLAWSGGSRSHFWLLEDLAAGVPADLVNQPPAPDDPNELDQLAVREPRRDPLAVDRCAIRVTDDGRVFVWGLEAIGTIGIAQGTGLVGDFNQATIYDREQARVGWFESGGLGSAGAEIASRNQLVPRAEERVGFACHRPAAFCSLTGL
jgi:hypothetical protein